ncbi:MAG TPA: AIR synthase related protein [Euzebyales bacterium]|nr:AIR synthase related protein [Euzebyales bacterium]
MNQRPDAPIAVIAGRFMANRGRIAKQALHHVADALGPTDWVTGPGDDTALIHSGAGDVLAAGEAIFPPFVARDPFGAGVGAVVANVNDVAAMGGRPLAIVDTVVASADVARAVLAGLRHAADLYGLPIVGGHLTITSDAPSLSAFVVGDVGAPLLARNARAGQVLLMAACLDGRLRSDFGFYPSYDQRGTRVRGDLGVLRHVADTGAAVAAKDISMAGTLGTLAMLLQPTGCGALVDLAAIPRPQDVPLPTWLDVFPSYGFLLCASADRVDEIIAAFAARDLACARIGLIDDTGALVVRLDGARATLLDDVSAHGTGLAGADSIERGRPQR